MPDKKTNQKADKVKIYSTSWCAFCHQVKKYLESIKIDYQEIDVEKDRDAAEEMVNKTGQMGVPVVEIGDTVIVGFDKPKIDAALQQVGLK